jgi:hypothetical protein
MLIDAQDVACGIAEVSSDLVGVGVDGLGDLSAVGGDEIDSCDCVVDHDGDDDTQLIGWRTIEDPHTTYLDTVIKCSGAIGVVAEFPPEDGGVEGGRDGYIRGGDFEVTDLAVSVVWRHGGLLRTESTACWSTSWKLVVLLLLGEAW